MRNKFFSSSLVFTLVIAGALAMLWITAAYQTEEIEMEATLFHMK